MAKKKDDGFEEFLEAFKDLLSLKDKDAGNTFSDMYDQVLELMNTNFYRYKRPDYKKGYDNIVPDWLGPIWNAQHDDSIRELCDFVANDGKDVDEEQKCNDFKKYLWFLFDAYEQDDTNSVWKLYGIYWLMEHFGIKDLDLVLEALRQDAYFISHYTLGVEDLMISALYQNADGNLNRLKEFMYSQGLVPIGKQMVFSAIVCNIKFHPEQRLSIVSWLVQFLNHTYDICMQGAYPGNIEHYIKTLAQFGVTETLPMIEKILRDIDVPGIEYTNDIDTIKKDMQTPYDLSEKELTLEHFVETWDSSHVGNDDFLKWLDSDDIDDEYEEDYSNLYDTDEPQKRYSIDVTWNDSEETINPVSVQLVVPSNLYLDNLAKIIMLAFGRKDLPSWYFVDMMGDTYTLPNGRVGKLFAKNGDDFEDASSCTLEDVLNENNSQVRFYLNFPAKNNEKDWIHTISLLKSDDYDKKARKLILIKGISGVYPPKKFKHAADYISQYNGKAQKSPDIKVIRKAIDEWVKENE